LNTLNTLNTSVFVLVIKRALLPKPNDLIICPIRTIDTIRIGLEGYLGKYNDDQCEQYLKGEVQADLWIR